MADALSPMPLRPARGRRLEMGWSGEPAGRPAGCRSEETAAAAARSEADTTSRRDFAANLLQVQQRLTDTSIFSCYTAELARVLPVGED